MCKGHVPLYYDSMKLKLFLKVSLLAFCLVIVIAAMNLTSSAGFKQDISQIFSSNLQTMKWCPEHTIDFQWLEKNLNAQASSNWSNASSKLIEKTFCSLVMEPVVDVDLAQVVFKPLLLAQSAEAKTALLEWSPQSHLFRVQGMPFKSTRLSRELLDEPK